MFVQNGSQFTNHFEEMFHFLNFMPFANTTSQQQPGMFFIYSRRVNKKNKELPNIYKVGKDYEIITCLVLEYCMKIIFLFKTSKFIISHLKGVNNFNSIITIYNEHLCPFFSLYIIFYKKFGYK